MKYLIFGNGYLGCKFQRAIKGSEIAGVDIADSNAVQNVLKEKMPDVIINCAGKTGRPNIDWCEDHKLETVYSNITGPLVLMNAAIRNNIYMVHIGSGCIFQGDNNKNGFLDDDLPPLDDAPSFYSFTKMVAERVLSNFPVLQLRIRMPLDSEKNPRNFITKITNYKEVINEPNSITVIDDLLFAAKELIKKRKVGIYNIVNPGVITHKEILDMYKEIVDPSFTYKIIETEKLNTKAKRSNCILNTDKLKKEGIHLKDIKERVREILLNYK